VVGALVLLPLIWLIPESTKAGALSWEALVSAKMGRLFVHSLFLGLGVALLSSLVGTLLALLSIKIVGMRWGVNVGVLLVIPLLIPPYIVAFAWYVLIGREGVLGEALFGFWGTVWVHFWIYLPIPLLLVQRALRQVDPDLEAAARLVAPWRVVLRRVTLPLILPTLKIAFLLVFILSFGEVSVANFLRYPVFSMQSFTYFTAFYDTKMAILTALPTVVVVLVLRWGMGQIMAQSPLRLSLKPLEQIALSRGVVWVLQGVMVVMVMIALMPLVHLWYVSDLASFKEAWQQGWAPLMRSLVDAGFGATLLMVLGFLGGYWLQKGFRGGGLLEGILLLGFMLPASIVGMGLSLFWNQAWSGMIYGSVGIILLAYLSKYLFITTKLSHLALAQIPTSMEESASLMGASWGVVMRRILIPLSLPSLQLGWLVGFWFAIRESTMTMLLYPAGEATLPIHILTQMANGDPAVVASLSLMMVGVVVIPLGIYWVITRSRR